MERLGAAKLEREGEEHTAMIQEYEENSVSYLQITSVCRSGHTLDASGPGVQSSSMDGSVELQ